jgi:hypothetical protein
MIFISVAVIIIPIVTYTIFFRKMGILWDIIVGSLSYIFYFPTYACLIPIYAKCRLDDVTKANTNLGARNAKLKETWSVIKMIDLGKYFFWNVVLGATLLVFHSIILVKFFMLLTLLFLFSLISIIKWIPGLVYIIKYKCLMRNNQLEPTDVERDNNIANMKLRVFDTIKRFEDDFTYNIK